jgi:hypothetical protein
MRIKESLYRYTHPGYVAIPYIIEAVAAAASTTVAVEASNKQAEAATQAADYNAKLDVANANQLAMNANANIAKQRQQDQEYQSNQRAALAASGVLSGTGSPMALQATTAGRQEQDIQTYWTSVQEKESQLYSSAEEGVYEGQEEADIYHLQGAADIFKGVGSMTKDIGEGVSAYEGS